MTRPIYKKTAQYSKCFWSKYIPTRGSPLPCAMLIAVFKKCKRVAATTHYTCESRSCSSIGTSYRTIWQVLVARNAYVVRHVIDIIHCFTVSAKKEKPYQSRATICHGDPRVSRLLWHRYVYRKIIVKHREKEYKEVSYVVMFFLLRCMCCRGFSRGHRCCS